ncbi:hypothetical protein [Tabrizicola thermarum]|uniref:hypothetical protein n=1 Tax=Tabrizicola thermarum TaxID=2670345 RepID=UPI000FFB15EF|nr:hypothetical protein [Tabrizicola thermarum]
MRKTALFLIVGLACAACAPFPELDALDDDTSPPPQLLPIDSLLKQGQATMADPGPPLAARAARLKMRAAAIGADRPAT